MSALYDRGATPGPAALADHLQKPCHLVVEIYDFMGHPTREAETPIIKQMIEEHSTAVFEPVAVGAAAPAGEV